MKIMMLPRGLSLCPTHRSSFLEQAGCEQTFEPFGCERSVREVILGQATAGEGLYS